MRDLAYVRAFRWRGPVLVGWVLVGWVLGAGALVAGCGSSSSTVVSPPSTSSGVSGVAPVSSVSAASSALSAPAASSAPATASPGVSAAASQSITVSPATGLRDGQTVRVRASGFSGNEALQVIECAAKGTATGPGDCNLAGMTGAQADPRGNLAVDFTVSAGPFGGNKITCTQASPCLISVTQATLAPTQEADQLIAFGTATLPAGSAPASPAAS